MADTFLHQPHPAGAVIRQGDAYRISNYQGHIPVDSSIKIEVPDQRHDLQILGIAHPHQKGVLLPVSKAAGEVDGKCAVSPLVPA